MSNPGRRESGFNSREDERVYIGVLFLSRESKNAREKSRPRTWRNGVGWVREVDTRVVLGLMAVGGSQLVVEGIGVAPAAADETPSTQLGRA